MLLETGSLDGEELIKGVRLVIELGEELAHEVDLNAPELNSVARVRDLEGDARRLKGVAREAKPTAHDIEEHPQPPRRATANLEARGRREAAGAGSRSRRSPGTSRRRPEAPKALEKPGRPAGAVELTLERPPEDARPSRKIFMDGKVYDLVDEIVLVDKKSEADHELAITEAKQDWTSNLDASKYPDKTTIGQARAATYVLTVRGTSSWKIKNLKAGKEIIIAKADRHGARRHRHAIEIDGQGHRRLEDRRLGPAPTAGANGSSACPGTGGLEGDGGLPSGRESRPNAHQHVRPLVLSGGVRLARESRRAIVFR